MYPHLSPFLCWKSLFMGANLWKVACLQISVAYDFRVLQWQKATSEWLPSNLKAIFVSYNVRYDLIRQILPLLFVEIENCLTPAHQWVRSYVAKLLCFYTFSQFICCFLTFCLFIYFFFCFRVGNTYVNWHLAFFCYKSGDMGRSDAVRDPQLIPLKFISICTETCTFTLKLALAILLTHNSGGIHCASACRRQALASVHGLCLAWWPCVIYTGGSAPPDLHKNKQLVHQYANIIMQIAAGLL